MCILIEEPENNLYPTNQEKISYYLADLRTKKHKPQVIISTHSPYILSALNNTLYAGQLLNKKIEIEKIEKILPSSLKPSEFIAYKIENGMATNIIDTETNLINAEEIDGASDSIMDKFDMLLELNHTPKVNK